jgi:hypothetical protein
MKPSIGRIVLFFPPTDEDREPYPAMVTRVHPGNDDSGLVDLVTFGPSSIYFQHNIPGGDPARFPPNAVAGTWQWPPRVT